MNGIYTYTHIYIYIHVPICIKWPPCRARGKCVGAYSSFSDRKFPALAGTSPLNAVLSFRRLPEHAAVRGPAGGRERQGTRPQRTHSLVIHGAHRTSPSAAGMVPRRPTFESTIAQPLPGDVQCSEQLHVRVPFAHSLLVPSHSNVTPSGAAAPPQRNSRRCVHIVAVREPLRCAHRSGRGAVCASHVIVAHRITPGYSRTCRVGRPRRQRSRRARRRPRAIRHKRERLELEADR
jgi:hypothetical protein